MKDQAESRRTQRLQIPGGVAQGADILRAGGTVAFPTETVYGLGANALNPAAVEKIFVAKQRPNWDPLIVHIDSSEMLPRVAAVTPELRAHTEALIAAFWPGPLTLLLPRTVAIPDAVTAGRPLVGVRMPAHEVARELIHLAGVPIAAPSANTFGGTSPTTAQHVLADLDTRIDAVLDGGPTTVGLESTVFDVAALTIYRPGAVTASMLARVLGVSVHTVSTSTDSADPTTLPSPGMALRHYAPRARLVLVDTPAAFLAEISRHPPADVGVMLPDDWDFGAAAVQFRWGPWSENETLSRLIYLGLRMLDTRGAKVIVCPLPPPGGLADALRDRLQKAARPE